MLADDRRYIYSVALNDWKQPASESNKNATNTWFDIYFWIRFDITDLERELPELWDQMENKIFDLNGNYPGFNQIGREWRVRALERAIEKVEITL